MSLAIEELVQEDIISEVLKGMSKNQKQLPSKLFYDERGSALFDEICKTDEYYVTRTETEIMRNNITEISSVINKDTLLIELGSGSSVKTKMILDNASGLAGYIPVDISSQHLVETAARLRKLYPDFNIIPVSADYTKDFDIPFTTGHNYKRIVYYPGSSIGNFTPEEAKIFLKRMARLCTKNGGLVIGVDLVKSKEMLESAYNDKQGLTAEFNLNILSHINQMLGADFTPEKFRHLAFYNAYKSRVEMHLVSLENQDVHLFNQSFHIRKFETILTEISQKYTTECFEDLAADYYNVKKIWVDNNRLFAIFYMKVR
jgi:dimethylhistidine N-methyltransferase